MVVRYVAVVAVLLVLGTSAGAGAALQSGEKGVVQGVVTHGLACTKQQLHPCSLPSPLPAVGIVFVRNGHAVAQTTTGINGTYRVRLRAGLYAIQLPGRERWQPTHVDVQSGRVTRLTITIDTPITAR